MVVVSDRGYREVNSVVGRHVVSLAVVAHDGDNLTGRNTSIKFSVDQFRDDVVDALEKLYDEQRRLIGLAKDQNRMDEETGPSTSYRIPTSPSA